MHTSTRREGGCILSFSDDKRTSSALESCFEVWSSELHSSLVGNREQCSRAVRLLSKSYGRRIWIVDADFFFFFFFLARVAPRVKGG